MAHRVMPAAGHGGRSASEHRFVRRYEYAGSIRRLQHRPKVRMRPKSRSERQVLHPNWLGASPARAIRPLGSRSRTAPPAHGWYRWAMDSGSESKEAPRPAATAPVPRGSWSAGAPAPRLAVAVVVVGVVEGLSLLPSPIQSAGRYR